MIPARVIELQASEWNKSGLASAANELVLELYDREQLALRRYLVYLGLDRETAAETVQESFLRLHKHLLAGGDRSNLRAWLYRVAHNFARNVQTSARMSRTGSLGEVNARGEIADEAASAEEKCLVAEERRAVEQAMARLSTAQRQCLLLRSQGLKYREIAEALNLSTSTVAENVQRGLEKLKELL
jgi:RNA polymerase sigma-70 factor (ECF subfamily)